MLFKIFEERGRNIPVLPSISSSKGESFGVITVE